ncbi:PHB depolymerase family esterase [Arenibacter sp. GZD96]|uniref:carboxylesterase family protein n=1 Tax=Aurantibrevibacter litoralis TaxID=3106030 RepID=UPI002AFE11F5|nr:alpha/beta fold hydrolase [Arenibacter sp. GZD-96]MEA1787447.1 PHB depolymerase family esterase [Arenibacter sp. GZD-96]
MKFSFIIIYCFLLFQGCSSVQSQLIDGELEITSKETYSYYLYYPEEYETQPDEKFPLLLFLHGGGESGDSLVTVKRNGPPGLIAKGKQFPFLILAPQNPDKKKWWNTRAVAQLLDTIVASNRVDPSRIYLTGLSRGGAGAWEMAVQYPDRFAALAVVCGMAPLPYASWIDKKMPIWVFHGDKDESIPISESIDMVAKLKEMGYNVQFTMYKGVGHNSWERAYATEELYRWFVRQKRMDVESAEF